MSNKGQRFHSVWDAIEDTPRQAASMRARAELMIALQSWIKASGKTQAEAARLFDITQPRMSDLMRGKITLFSLDSMIDMATAQVMDILGDDVIAEVERDGVEQVEIHRIIGEFVLRNLVDTAVLQPEFGNKEMVGQAVPVPTGGTEPRLMVAMMRASSRGITPK